MRGAQNVRNSIVTSHISRGFQANRNVIFPVRHQGKYTIQYCCVTKRGTARGGQRRLVATVPNQTTTAAKRKGRGREKKEKNFSRGRWHWHQEVWSRSRLSCCSESALTSTLCSATHNRCCQFVLQKGRKRKSFFGKFFLDRLCSKWELL